MIKLISLDFDGVIIESVDIKTKALEELFKSYKNSIDKIIEYNLKHNAVSRFVKFKYIYENILKKEYTPEIKEKLGEQYSNLILKKMVDCPFVPGALDFLKTFSKKFPLYLISATPKKELENIVKQRNIDKHFKQIMGIPPGSKIEFIKKAILQENVKPKEAVYIGDMPRDYKIAQKTGVQFVGRKNKKDFGKIKAPVFSDMKEIKNYLKNKIK